MENFKINQESAGQSHPMPAGINENVRLVSITRHEDEMAPGTDFNFQDGDNNIFRGRMFDINWEQVSDSFESGDYTHSADNKRFGFEKGQKITGKQGQQIAAFNMSNRILEILSCFKDPNSIDLDLLPFNTLAERINKVLEGTDFNKVPLRLKLVYNKSNFTNIPKFGAFIEPMSVRNSSITINPKDKITKDDKDSNPSNHPGDADPNVKDDKLPF